MDSHTQHHLAVATILQMATMLLVAVLDGCGYERSRNVVRTRQDFWQLASCYDDFTFRRAFRLSRRSFSRLVDKLKPALKVDESMACRSSGSAISAEVCVAVMLRVMAGASYLDLIMMFGVSRSMIYECFDNVTYAALRELPLQGFPKSEPELTEAACAFKIARKHLNPIHAAWVHLMGSPSRFRNLLPTPTLLITGAAKDFIQFLFRQSATPNIASVTCLQFVLEALTILWPLPSHHWDTSSMRTPSQYLIFWLLTKHM